jgi:hypothetical protein
MERQRIQKQAAAAKPLAWSVGTLHDEIVAALGIHAHSYQLPEDFGVAELYVACSAVMKMKCKPFSILVFFMRSEHMLATIMLRTYSLSTCECQVLSQPLIIPFVRPVKL